MEIKLTKKEEADSLQAVTTFTIKAIIIPQKMILIRYKNNFTFFLQMD